MVGVKSIPDSKVLFVSRINAEGTCPIWSHMAKPEPKSNVTMNRISEKSHHIQRHPRMGWKRDSDTLLTDHIQVQCPAASRMLLRHS